MAPPGLEDMTNQLKSMFSNMNRLQKVEKNVCKAALKIIKEEEAGKLINDEEIKNRAMKQQNKPVLFLLMR